MILQQKFSFDLFSLSPIPAKYLPPLALLHFNFFSFPFLAQRGITKNGIEENKVVFFWARLFRYFFFFFFFEGGREARN